MNEWSRITARGWVIDGNVNKRAKKHLWWHATVKFVSCESCRLHQVSPEGQGRVG